LIDRQGGAVRHLQRLERRVRVEFAALVQGRFLLGKWPLGRLQRQLAQTQHVADGQEHLVGAGQPVGRDDQQEQRQQEQKDARARGWHGKDLYSKETKIEISSI
jgi:hypothetical protein